MDEPIPSYTCPLCTNTFAGRDCHSSCPLAKGCKMVKCPRCNYEFVEEGTIANWLRNLLGIRGNEARQ